MPSAADLNSVAILGAGTAVAVGSSGNIMRSTDGGQTWTRRYDSPESSLNFESVDFTPDGVGVAVSSSGLALKTEDGGWTWERIRES